MITKLERIGDELGVVIDDALLKLLRFDAETPLEMKVEGGRIIVSRVQGDEPKKCDGSSE